MTHGTDPIQEVAQSLASNVCERLSEFGSDIPEPEAARAAYSWLSAIHETSPDAYRILQASPEALDELASAIVTSIVLDLAEERPGTNPWSHERNVPLPLSLAYSQLQLLTAITDLAITNQDYRWAENSNANALALSGLLGQIPSHRHMEKDDNDPGEGIIYTPQPAMAYVARFLRNTADRISTDKWSNATHGPLTRHDNVPKLFRQHATILERLTKAFGRPVNPKSN